MAEDEVVVGFEDKLCVSEDGEAALVVGVEAPEGAAASVVAWHVLPEECDTGVACGVVDCGDEGRADCVVCKDPERPRAVEAFYGADHSWDAYAVGFVVLGVDEEDADGDAHAAAECDGIGRFGRRFGRRFERRFRSGFGRRFRSGFGRRFECRLGRDCGAVFEVAFVARAVEVFCERHGSINVALGANAERVGGLAAHPKRSLVDRVLEAHGQPVRRGDCVHGGSFGIVEEHDAVGLQQAALEHGAHAVVSDHAVHGDEVEAVEVPWRRARRGVGRVRRAALERRAGHLGARPSAGVFRGDRPLDGPQPRRVVFNGVERAHALQEPPRAGPRAPLQPDHVTRKVEVEELHGLAIDPRLARGPDLPHPVPPRARADARARRTRQDRVHAGDVQPYDACDGAGESPRGRRVVRFRLRGQPSRNSQRPVCGALPSFGRRAFECRWPVERVEVRFSFICGEHEARALWSVQSGNEREDDHCGAGQK